MSDLPNLVLGLVAGVVAGTAYFGGLWLTVRRLPESGRPALLMLVSYLVRMGLVLAGALLFRADWPQIVAYILGLTIARTILVRSLGSARARDGGAEECT